jgi:hypothetical protein
MKLNSHRIDSFCGMRWGHQGQLVPDRQKSTMMQGDILRS